MKKKFLTNLAFLILVNLVIKPFWILGIDRTVQNDVGTEEYGMYFALLNFSFLFNMILDFGINNFNNRAVSRHENLLNKLVPNIFMIKMSLSAVYLVIMALFAILAGFKGEQLYLLGFLLVNQVLVSFILYFRSNFAALQHFKTDAVISVLDRVLMIIIVGLVLWSNITGWEISIRFFVYAQTASYILTAIISFITLQLKAPGIKLSFDISLFKKILRLSYPFALLGILMMIYNRIDGIMIERLLSDGKEEAGIYAASFRLLDVANMIGFAFASLLLPIFSRMIKQKEDFKPLLNISYKMIFFIAVMAASICFWFKVPLMDLFYKGATEYWAQIFSLLMISFIGIGTMYIYGSLLTANGNLRQLNYIGLGGVILNVALNYFLIIEYKALGATAATLITQLLVAGLHIAVAFRVFKFTFDLFQFIQLTGYIAVCVVVGYISTLLPVSWLFQITGAVFTITVLGYVFRLWSPKDWLGLQDAGLNN